MEARAGHLSITRPSPRSNWRRIATGGGDWWQNLSYRARDWAYERLQIGLEDDPRTADFLAGMLIGYRQEIPPDIEQDFRRTGTIHVFAVSGQNIAEMFVVALILLQLCGLVRWRWAWIDRARSCCSTACSPARPPAPCARRSWRWPSCSAWRLGRPLNALGCWSLAFLAMLIWNPPVLLDPGAQLSFGIVLGLILIAPPIMRVLHGPFRARSLSAHARCSPTRKNSRQDSGAARVLLAAAAIAATLVCEPITAVDFHQVTPISIFANLIVVPLAGLITMVGTMSVAVSLVSTPLAALLNNANWLLAKILIWFVAFLAHEPGAIDQRAGLRRVASPRPSFVVAPLRDSACLLIRASAGSVAVQHRAANGATPSAVWHLLQFYGINRLDGLVLAQISSPDNSGAEAIVRDFRPRHLVVPVLRTRSPLEKAVPEIAALSGDDPSRGRRARRSTSARAFAWKSCTRAGQSRNARGRPRASSCFFTPGRTRCSGRVASMPRRNATCSRRIRTCAPTCSSWAPKRRRTARGSLRSRCATGCKSRHAHRASTSTDPPPVPDSCRVWPLNQTGAVDIHFNGDKILLRPWVALPQ